MSVRKKSVVGLVAACVLAMPGTAFAGSLNGTCNSTTGGTNTPVVDAHPTGCKTVKPVDKAL